MNNLSSKTNPTKLKLISALVLSLASFSAIAAESPGLNHPPYHIKPHTNLLQPSGFSPSQIRLAYNINQISQQGAGQTIAIIDAFDNPNAESDLAVFNSTFGLPACTTANGCFKKIYASGTKPPGDTGWGTEIVLDIQWAHAIAPQAKILLVEGADNSNAGLLKAVQVAVAQGATVVSMSWGQNEFSSSAQYDSYFNVPGVTFLASTGDSGNQVQWPAVSPYIIATGGTSLRTDSQGNYTSETAWRGTGGGISRYISRPSYQADFANQNNPNNMRGVPDVSLVSDPNTGASVYDSYGSGGWVVMGGTSLAAPAWAGLVAVINSASSTPLPSLNALLYQAARTNYLGAYHDITSGTNGSCGAVCTTNTGYDYVTGLGTPKSNTLASLIAGSGGTCVRANQTMTISPTTQTVTPGGSANYTISVKNNDSTNCTASNFNLVATPPSALTASLASATLAVAPGATATTTLTVGTSSSTPAGTYTVPVKSTSASVSTNVATVNANLAVQTTGTCTRTNPTVSFTPNTTQTIQQNASVTINFKINNNDSSTCASSNFVLTTTTNNALIKSALSNASFAIAPGGNATGYMIIKSSNVAVVGSTYSATMTAQDPANNRSTSFTSNVLIGNPLHNSQ